MVWELLRLSPLCRGHIHHNHHQYPPQLSNESPGRVVPSLIVISTIFQADINFRFSIFAFTMACLITSRWVCMQPRRWYYPTDSKTTLTASKAFWWKMPWTCNAKLKPISFALFFLQNVLKNCIAIAVPCHPFLLGHYYCSFFSQTQFCLSIYVCNIFIKYLIIRSFS